MRPPARWDEAADVLVLGGGPGGAAAAWSAAQSGASTVLVERRAVLGGNAPLSSGYAAFAGTALQAAASVADDAERFLEDMRAEAERRAAGAAAVLDEPVARTYAERSASAARALGEMGVGFRGLIPRPARHSRDRIHALERVSELPDVFARALDAAGAAVRPSVAERLFSDGERVTGARLRAGDAAVDIRAEAVVLATGGFQADAETRALNHPADLSAAPHLGIDTAAGDGHRMAAAVGAQLVNMSLLSPFPIVATALLESAIAVDRDGERFHDETDPFATAAALQGVGGEGFYVFDARTARERSGYLRVFRSTPVAEETLEGLARRIGVSPTGLGLTVAAWNDAVRREAPSDPRFGRRSLDRRGIAEPPFHAARIEIGIHVSYGGVRVDAEMRALDPWGEPIPGLFAVGDCAGSLAPAMELGGMHLGAALTLGMLAGERAAVGAIRQEVAP